MLSVVAFIFIMTIQLRRIIQYSYIGQSCSLPFHKSLQSVLLNGLEMVAIGVLWKTCDEEFCTIVAASLLIIVVIDTFEAAWNTGKTITYSLPQAAVSVISGSVGIALTIMLFTR